MSNESSQIEYPWFPFIGQMARMQKLEESERRIFASLGIEYVSRMIKIPFKNSEIYTISVQCDAPEKTLDHPIVLVHGFGAGVAMWGAAIRMFSKFQTVHAFDLLGFGRSSRPTFSTNHRDAENEMVESIEMWRNEMSINKMNLVAHSFGGYLATSYAIKYPSRVNKLVLADPWGFNEVNPTFEQNLSTTAKVISSVYLKFNPLALLRAVGSYGPSMMRRFRPDLREKYSDHVYDYVYLCNSQSPTGEAAFKSLAEKLAWAKEPMSKRFHGLDENLPVVFIHGQRSWIDWTSISDLISGRSNTDMMIIEEAGHHVYADNTSRFTEIVIESLRKGVQDDMNDSKREPVEVES
ncbi:unnamed protein product [Caenorhabditis bovis]|uniref:AB hydrolase-1 domain-containing protein n=1 Tax=Caenorhabditis bovis TaxID=2654633 RepID=A0A8S1EAU2_9PELO|nr:unnamed protein product [Caenorhabditis bovis]